MNGAPGLLSALGIRVRRVQELSEGAVYLEDRRLLLVDGGLSDEQINDVANQVIPAL